MIVSVVDLHIEHAGKLLDRSDQRLRNAVGSPTRSAGAAHINGQVPIAEFQPAITDETVALCDQAPGLLLRTRPLEVFVDGGHDGIIR